MHLHPISTAWILSSFIFLFYLPVLVHVCLSGLIFNYMHRQWNIFDYHLLCKICTVYCNWRGWQRVPLEDNGCHELNFILTRCLHDTLKMIEIAFRIYSAFYFRTAEKRKNNFMKRNMCKHGHGHTQFVSTYEEKWAMNVAKINGNKSMKQSEIPLLLTFVYTI